MRAKAYDGWAQQFLDPRPECTVLHLGCGLDTRVCRVDPPPTVRWYVIDLPDVIELRQRLFPLWGGTQSLAASPSDPRLLETISGETPVLVIADGLTPYRQAVDGLALLRRLTEYFPRMEMLFGGYGRHGVRFLQRYGCVKVSGAQTDWRINDPRAIERAVPGLILDAELWVHGRAGD